MTRKHFNAIAKAIAHDYLRAETSDGKKAIALVAVSIAVELTQFNSEFNFIRFLGEALPGMEDYPQ